MIHVPEDIHNTLEGLTPAEARQIQQDLRNKVITKDEICKVRFVAGVDVGFEQSGTITRAAIAVLSYPTLQPVEIRISRRKTTFPYVPGLLSFRELPAILDAMALLETEPDIYLVDGQGIAHPRRLGIASHLGVLVDRPAIGVAKTRLIGSHAEVGPKKGDWQALYDGSEIIGCVLRTRSNVKPLYVSPGHKCSIDTARHLVLSCVTTFRLPETTRWADKCASNRLTTTDKQRLATLGQITL